MSSVDDPLDQPAATVDVDCQAPSRMPGGGRRLATGGHHAERSVPVESGDHQPAMDGAPERHP
jgi:hypothetical protein